VPSDEIRALQVVSEPHRHEPEACQHGGNPLKVVTFLLSGVQVLVPLGVSVQFSCQARAAASQAAPELIRSN
jgi:hypothetical protein